MESKLRMLQKYTENSMEMLNEPALLLDSNLVIQSVNNAFLNYFKLMKQELIEQPFLDFIHTKWQTKRLDDFLYTSAVKSGDITLKHDFPLIGLRKVVINSYPTMDEQANRAFMILITIQEKP
jgi:PAS domain-containing protein